MAPGFESEELFEFLALLSKAVRRGAWASVRVVYLYLEAVAVVPADPCDAIYDRYLSIADVPFWTLTNFPRPKPPSEPAVP